MDEIDDQKNRLFRLEAIYKSGEQIREARNALEIEIELLEKEVDKLYTRGINPENKLELLEVCRTKCRSLDHKLDELEDVSPDTLHALRERLISLILAKHPGQEGSYQEMRLRYASLRHLSSLLEIVEEKLEQITVSLGEAGEAVKKVKRFWILSYIFGANPNAVIGKSLEFSLTGAKECLEALEGQEVTQEGSLFFEELKGDLIEFQDYCKKQWSFSRISNGYQQYKQRFATLLEAVTHLQQSTKLGIEENEKGLDHWIETHSKT